MAPKDYYNSSEIPSASVYWGGSEVLKVDISNWLNNTSLHGLQL